MTELIRNYIQINKLQTGDLLFGKGTQGQFITNQLKKISLSKSGIKLLRSSLETEFLAVDKEGDSPEQKRKNWNIILL